MTTIGTPVPALSTRFRWTKAWPLVALYRWSGPTRFLCRALSDALLGPEAVAAQPDQAQAVIDAFRRADRSGMVHAMRSMMLKRPDLSDCLPRVAAPTLVLAARATTTKAGRCSRPRLPAPPCATPAPACCPAARGWRRCCWTPS